MSSGMEPVTEYLQQCWSRQLRSYTWPLTDQRSGRHRTGFALQERSLGRQTLPGRRLKYIRSGLLPRRSTATLAFLCVRCPLYFRLSANSRVPGFLQRQTRRSWKDAYWFATFLYTDKPDDLKRQFGECAKTHAMRRNCGESMALSVP